MKQTGICKAKDTFLEVLARAKEAPIIITNHGKPDSVVVSYEHYLVATAKKHGLSVVTRDTGHFEGRSIGVVNPYL